MRSRPKFRPNVSNQARPQAKVNSVECKSPTRDNSVERSTPNSFREKSQSPIRNSVSSHHTYSPVSPPHSPFRAILNKSRSPSPVKYVHCSPLPVHSPQVNFGSHPIPTADLIVPVTGERRRIRRITESSVVSVVNSNVSQATLFDKRKQDHDLKFKEGRPTRDKLTMFDLIFIDKDSKKKDKSITTEIKSSLNTSVDVDAVKSDESDDDENQPVPRVKVGPNGEVILDESSTLIESKDTRLARRAMKNAPLVVQTNENYKKLNNKKEKKTAQWNKRETVRFYKALSIVGTDFSLMTTVFKNRSRDDLKRKFNKEYRCNEKLVNNCLQYGLKFDLSILEEETESENEMKKSKEESSKVKKTRKRKKKDKLESATSKKPRKRSRDRKKYYTSSASDADVEDVEV